MKLSTVLLPAVFASGTLAETFFRFAPGGRGMLDKRIVCGLGDTCRQACGGGATQCGASGAFCFDPTLGETCCGASGYYCPSGDYCAPVDGYCCFNTETPAQCASRQTFSLPAGFTSTFTLGPVPSVVSTSAAAVKPSSSAVSTSAVVVKSSSSVAPTSSAAVKPSSSVVSTSSVVLTSTAVVKSSSSAISSATAVAKSSSTVVSTLAAVVISSSTVRITSVASLGPTTTLHTNGTLTSASAHTSIAQFTGAAIKKDGAIRACVMGILGLLAAGV